MLRIHRQIKRKNAKNPAAGDVNGFLQRIIIEVITDNYRQMLAEAVTNSADELRLDPPLRANERGISGLFASAIGRVSSRYRAEARVDRPSLVEEEGDGDTNTGRVDYLVWYERRVFGIELKASSMSIENTQATKSVEDRWGKVVRQTKEVQKDLRARAKEDPIHFPKPISIALLVVIGRRKLQADKVFELDKTVDSQREAFISGLGSVGKTMPPQFVASYLFPDKFREFHPRKKGQPDYNSGETVLYTPFVAFLARSYVKSS